MHLLPKTAVQQNKNQRFTAFPSSGSAVLFKRNMEKRFVYADNAASTAVSERVLNAMLPFLSESFGNPSSIHRQGRDARRAIENAREQIAECLNCHPSEIYFTSGGTESDWWAVTGYAKAQYEHGKRHILTTAVEHKAVLEACKKLEKQGFEVTYLKPDRDGIITAEQVENAIRKDTALVTVMYANNEVGTVMPVEEIGRVCKEKGVCFHTDAVQAVGNVRIDVKKQNIAMLSLSGHKIHAMKGIGVLYVRNGTVLEAMITGGAQEKGRRAGTENVPAIVGLGEAVKAAYEDFDGRYERTVKVRDRLIDGLVRLGGRLNGSREKRLMGNVNVSFEGFEGETMLLLLDSKGICASGGSACSSGQTEPSHVLTAMGLTAEQARGALRFSIDGGFTAEDADYIIEAMKDIIFRLNKMKGL